MMTSYLFIDGAYLRSHYERQMQQFYGCVPAICFDVLAANLGADRKYYYDAVNYQKGAKETQEECDARVARMHALHDHISSQPGFHVREGHVRKSSQKKKQEQKGVDVQLAVDALEHAARRNMERAILFAGDLDFEPLLTSLVRLGVATKLIYVPQTATPELLHAADEIQKVTLEHFWQWAAPSFQNKHPRVTLGYRQAEPEAAQFVVLRRGKWGNRQATLYEHPVTKVGRLFVEPGDELSDPSYTFTYSDAEPLPKAFELTFGSIIWE